MPTLEPFQVQSTTTGYRAPELGGIKVDKSVKWLGIQFGEVSREEAYAKPIIQARRRASIISTLQLTLKEKAVLVQQWLYPVLHLTLQAYPPIQEEVKAVKALVAQAMNCTTFTHTVDMMTQPKEAGGVGLWHPKAYRPLGRIPLSGALAQGTEPVWQEAG